MESGSVVYDVRRRPIGTQPTTYSSTFGYPIGRLPHFEDESDENQIIIDRLAPEECVGTRTPVELYGILFLIGL